jgi:DNA-binding NarL/FixJ family response regulator
VLLDLALGDADGFDVLVEFRNTYPALPVVVVSASDRTSDVIRAHRQRRDGLRAQALVERQLHEALRMVMTAACTCRRSMLGLEGAAQPRWWRHRAVA